MKIAVLGAGMVGRTIALELAQTHEVASFDRSDDALISLGIKAAERKLKIGTNLINLLDLDEINQHEHHILEDFDLIVSAVPGFMGYNVLKAVITAGKNIVDISFFPEDPSTLDALAKEKGVIALVDFGVAPGMSNLILGYCNSIMKVTDFECLVGGLPKVRVKPFEYKAPFSPIDVLEEYTRPARYMENGIIVTKPALSDTELVTFKNIGTLESFNTDGLRSILFTMSHIPNMKEKTLRYPGHVDLMKALISAGFLSKTTIAKNITPQTSIQISPLEFTSTILFDQWKLNPGDKEFTVMRIKVSDENKTLIYDLYDEYDAETKTSSMSRTTGYAACAAVELLRCEMWNTPGVWPPEIIGGDEQRFMYIMNYLHKKGINYKETIIDRQF